MTNPNTEDPDYFDLQHAEVSIDEALWHGLSNVQDTITRTLTTILEHDECISILLTNDDHIQQLNKDFRLKDKPTNVLSFPSDENKFLGDIAVSFNTLKKEANEQDKEFMHHFIHMLIHGVLHLKGYDHLDDDEAEKMESLEIKILEDMGIKNPYI